ncbi:MAG TPA: hypothetical protein VHE35_09840 [Kofleriaceae bacterium]|nr:hypothetical protein [Kofleriaceae bacterium]
MRRFLSLLGPLAALATLCVTSPAHALSAPADGYWNVQGFTGEWASGSSSVLGALNTSIGDVQFDVCDYPSLNETLTSYVICDNDVPMFSDKSQSGSSYTGTGEATYAVWIYDGDSDSGTRVQRNDGLELQQGECMVVNAPSTSMWLDITYNQARS